jgi:hypothetical protein
MEWNGRLGFLFFFCTRPKQNRHTHTQKKMSLFFRLSLLPSLFSFSSYLPPSRPLLHRLAGQCTPAISMTKIKLSFRRLSPINSAGAPPFPCAFFFLLLPVASLIASSVVSSAAPSSSLLATVCPSLCAPWANTGGISSAGICFFSSRLD